MRWDRHDYKLSEIYSRSLLKRNPAVWKCTQCWDSNKNMFQKALPSVQPLTIALEVHHVHNQVKGNIVEISPSNSQIKDVGLEKWSSPHSPMVKPKDDLFRSLEQIEYSTTASHYFTQNNERVKEPNAISAAPNHQITFLCFIFFMVLMWYYVLMKLVGLFSFFRGRIVTKNADTVEASNGNNVDSKDNKKNKNETIGKGVKAYGSTKRVSFNTNKEPDLDKTYVDTNSCELWDIYDTAAKTSPMTTNNLLFSLAQSVGSKEADDTVILDPKNGETDLCSDSHAFQSLNESLDVTLPICPPLKSTENREYKNDQTNTPIETGLRTPPRKFRSLAANATLSVDRGQFARNSQVLRNKFMTEQNQDDANLTIPDLLKMRTMFTRDFQGKSILTTTPQRITASQEPSHQHHLRFPLPEQTVRNKQGCMDKENVDSINVAAQDVNRGYVSSHDISTPIKYFNNPLLLKTRKNVKM